MEEQKLESPISKEERIRKLQESISALKSQLQNPDATLHQVLTTNKRSFILMWAEWLEELHELGEYTEPLTTISNHIKKEIRLMHLNDKTEFNIIHYIHEVLPDKYVDPRLSHKSKDGVENPPENASSIEAQKEFILIAFQNFREYHREFADVIKIYESHIKNPETQEDFTKLVEWREIAQFCNALSELSGQFSILHQMLDEGNVRQSISIFQLAMYDLLGADESFRLWAYKFGISPRQFQRIRSRESNPRSEKEDWKKKNPKEIIRRVLGSFHCPKCSFNLVCNRYDDDVTREETLKKFEFAGKKWKIPEHIKKTMRKKNLNPIEIAKLIWGKKIKLIEEK